MPVSIIKFANLKTNPIRLKIFICLFFAFAAGSFEPKAAYSAEKEAPAVTPADKEKLLHTAEQLAAQIGEHPQVKDLFDRSFFKQLSLEKLEDLLRQSYRTNGKVVAVKLAYAESSCSARFTFETEKDLVLPAALAVNMDTGRLTALFFQSAYPKNLSLEAVRRQLAALPGRTGFLAIKLNAPRRTLEALNEDAYFAIGSASKLYLLGTVVEKGFSWKKIFTLREESKSPPTGRLRNWPDGSPLTLHTLAAAMISESDNTASDVLADGLGRETIEAALPALGHSKPELLKPFLKTADMFRLKSDTEESVKYLNAPLSEKYKLLDALARRPLNTADLKPAPFGVDKIGWPASPADLCRLMEYFYRKGGKTARAIMAIEPGLDIPRNKFLYAGYKGGAEAGVLNMTWLLKTSGSDWYCLTGSWNNDSDKDNLAENKFFELMQMAINVIGQ